jgi:hypothetical protein
MSFRCSFRRTQLPLHLQIPGVLAAAAAVEPRARAAAADHGVAVVLPLAMDAAATDDAVEGAMVVWSARRPRGAAGSLARA